MFARPLGLHRLTWAVGACGASDKPRRLIERTADPALLLGVTCPVTGAGHTEVGGINGADD